MLNMSNHLGLVERKIRLEKGLTLDNVSADLGISRAFLSYAENGKKTLKEEDFIRFLNYYGVVFDFDLSLAEKVHSILDKLVMALTYRNRDREIQIAKSFMNDRYLYENSFGCIYLPLIDSFLTIHELSGLTMQEQSKVFEKAEEYLSLYSEDERALLACARAQHAKRSRKYSYSIHLYNEALSLLGKNQWPQLEGIIKMSLAIALSAELSFFEAYEMTKDADLIFTSHSNYIQALVCQNNIANFLIEMQCHKDAQKVIEKIFMITDSFPSPEIYIQSTKTLLLAMTLQDHFQEVIDYSNAHGQSFDNGNIGNYCLIPYCYYRLGDYNACLQAIKALSKEKPTADDKALFALLKAIIIQNPHTVEKEKQRMERVCYKQRNWWMLMILYQLMIYYYTETQEIELLIDAYAGQAMIFSHKLLPS